jgi:hypothetical protein
MLDRLPFKYLVAADTEFEFGGHTTLEAANQSGRRQRSVCLCAKELRTGQAWELRRGEFGSAPPFPTGPDTLVIAYYASAEMGTFRALGWSPPTYLLDLFTEFRARTNGLPTPNGANLRGALTYFGLDGIGTDEKHDTRLLILRGPPWTHSEWLEILAYCWTDVDALERLLPRLLPHIDLPRALLRGRYMKAAAAIEWNGVPIDVEARALLLRYRDDIQDDLIAAIDRNYGVFDGRTFKMDRWQAWLARAGIPWPVHESGRLDLSEDTFRQMAKSYPLVAPMHELRSSLSGFRLNDLAVSDEDGRNRTLLSAFRARTGRNQPSSSRFIFGPSVWQRFLIKPPPGFGLAYLDYQQQEFGETAVFSGDEVMRAAYLSGDPYLAFAKQARAVPAGATKQSHGPQRELFKQCVLAVQYGMEAEGVARRIGQPVIVGRELIRAYRETYRRCRAWSDTVVDQAILGGKLRTVFGWPIHIGENYNPRSLRNFPMQANGAEMLRLACCFATEQGIEVCAPVHDAVLICAPLSELDTTIERMRVCMGAASRVVLNGFELRTDVQVIRYPDRFQDGRGRVMWDQVMNLIAAQQTKQVA